MQNKSANNNESVRERGGTMGGVWDIDKIIHSSLSVTTDQYCRNMSVRRKKAYDKVLLLASAGIPALHLSVSRDEAIAIINILLHKLCIGNEGENGKYYASPTATLAAALREYHALLAGARIMQQIRPRRVRRVKDNQRRFWYIREDDVTILATKGHIEAESSDFKAIGGLND